jgi:hypothetical protein
MAQHRHFESLTPKSRDWEKFGIRPWAREVFSEYLGRSMAE